jgi:hypothetical protein
VITEGNGMIRTIVKHTLIAAFVWAIVGVIVALRIFAEVTGPIYDALKAAVANVYFPIVVTAILAVVSGGYLSAYIYRRAESAKREYAVGAVIFVISISMYIDISKTSMSIPPTFNNSYLNYFWFFLILYLLMSIFVGLIPVKRN